MFGVLDQFVGNSGKRRAHARSAVLTAMVVAGTLLSCAGSAVA